MHVDKGVEQVVLVGECTPNAGRATSVYCMLVLWSPVHVVVAG